MIPMLKISEIKKDFPIRQDIEVTQALATDGKTVIINSLSICGWL